MVKLREARKKIKEEKESANKQSILQSHEVHISLIHSVQILILTRQTYQQKMPLLLLIHQLQKLLVAHQNVPHLQCQIKHLQCHHAPLIILCFLLRMNFRALQLKKKMMWWECNFSINVVHACNKNNDYLVNEIVVNLHYYGNYMCLFSFFSEIWKSNQSNYNVIDVSYFIFWQKQDAMSEWQILEGELNSIATSVRTINQLKIICDS